MSAMVGNTVKSLSVLPLLMAHLADTPEAMRAACLFTGAYNRLKKACWTCTVSGSELNKIDSWPVRDFGLLHDKIKDWMQQLLEPGNVGKVDDACAAESVFLIDVCANVVISLVVR
jgi:hypothetical protein